LRRNEREGEKPEVADDNCFLKKIEEKMRKSPD